MRTVRDIMTPDPVVISPDAPVAEAVKILLDKRFNGLPVVDGSGKVVGIICQSDLVAQQRKLEIPSVFTLLGGFVPLPGWKKAERDVEKMTALTVAEAMTPDPAVVDLDMPLEDVAEMMVQTKFYTLPVVEEGKLLGIVGKEDILRTLIGKKEGA